MAAEASAAGDRMAEALAWRAASVAARSRDVTEARELATRGRVIATEAGLHDTASRILVTLAGIDVFAGRHGEARRVLQALARGGGGLAGAEALAQLGFLHLLAGEHGEAIECFDRSVARLDPSGVWAANSLSNRGLARAYSGDLRRAQQDLEKAVATFSALGAFLAVAEVRQNLGWVMDQAGDYVGALQAFTAADAVLEDTPASRGYLLRDRANTLMAVGLVSDAVNDAQASVAAFESAGREGDATESRLVHALALAVLGDHAEAITIADRARREFRAQGRPIHADHAQLISLRAVDAHSATRTDAAAARRLAGRLERRGTLNVALEARLTAARLAMWAGDTESAAADLAGAQGCRRSRRHELRLWYWQIVAELAAVTNDDRRALRASRSGLDVLDESQRTLGSTEARVNVAASSRRIGAVALRIARHRGPATLFDWMERVRAGALRYRPVRPEGDRELATAQAALRALAKEVEVGQVEGRDVSETIRRQASAERAIRLKLLEARGREPGAARASASLVRERLGDAVLIAYAGIGGNLVAVRLDGRRARSIELGPIEQIQQEVEHLRFASLRLAGGRMSSASLDGLHAGARRLDEMLLAPVDRSGRALVVVPMGVLFAVPWALLPSAADRPVNLAPSATMWLQASARSSGHGNRVLAAGPDLVHAHAEIAMLASIHRDAVTLEGDGARAGSVLAAVEGAELFHIACHGVFRSDNPLFSYLRVADGPLSVHELETLQRAPETVVLSSCDVGLTQPRPGNEWLGMATALLSLGTRSLVASVTPVPDAETTVRLMADMHRSMAAGTPVAEALRGATSVLADDDPEALAAKAAFVCIGA